LQLQRLGFVEPRNERLCLDRNLIVISILTGGSENGPSFSYSHSQYFNQPGMSRASTLHLTRQGATILGTDALGWDRPFGKMTEQFRATGDKSSLWDGHKAIVDKGAFIVQQMANLGALPLSGFMVGFFPIKLAECSAAPARVVAFLD
jgi:kynurenine formamidase